MIFLKNYMTFKEIENTEKFSRKKKIAFIESTSSETSENSKWTQNILIQEAICLQTSNKLWLWTIKFAITYFAIISLVLILFWRLFFANGVNI